MFFFSIYRPFSTHACTSTQIARSIRWLDSLKMYDLQSIFLRNKGKIPSGCYILKWTLFFFKSLFMRFLFCVHTCRRNFVKFIEFVLKRIFKFYLIHWILLSLKSLKSWKKNMILCYMNLPRKLWTLKLWQKIQLCKSENVQLTFPDIPTNKYNKY